MISVQTQQIKLARQAVNLENALFLRWFEAKRNHADADYVARLSRIRRIAFARVFRRQV